LNELSFSRATLGKRPNADSKSFWEDGGNPNGGSLGKTGELYEPVKRKQLNDHLSTTQKNC